MHENLVRLKPINWTPETVRSSATASWVPACAKTIQRPRKAPGGWRTPRRYRETKRARHSSSPPCKSLEPGDIDGNQPRKLMKEIRTQDWNTFCQKLNEVERGATVDIHWIDRESKREQDIARSAEFQEITFGRRDGCNDQVVIRAGA